MFDKIKSFQFRSLSVLSFLCKWYGLVGGIQRHFQQYFSFIGGEYHSTRRKPPTCRKSMTNFITWRCIEYTSRWKGFELTHLVVIDTDCTGSCKSNYHTIMTTTAHVCKLISKHHRHDCKVQSFLNRCLYIESYSIELYGNSSRNRRAWL